MNHFDKNRLYLFLSLFIVCLIFNHCQVYNQYIGSEVISTTQNIKFARQIQKDSIDKKTISGVYMIVPDFSTSQATNSKRAELRLKDGFGLAIESGENGIRPFEELQKYNKQAVYIRGSIHTNCFLAAEGYFSTFESYCIKNISVIQIQKR